MKSSLPPIHGRDCLDILYVGPLLHHGGSAMVASQLLVGLAQLGHRIRAIPPVTPETIDTGENFSRRHPEIKIQSYIVPYFYLHTAQPPSQEYNNAEDAGISRTFEAAISESCPDLLIIGRESFVWQLADLAIRERLPSMLIAQTAHIFGMTNLTSAAERERFREQFRKVDLMVSIAAHQRATMQRLRLRRPVLIPNPVDLAIFSPKPPNARLMKQLRLNSDSFVAAHISNLKAIKRASDIVASAREVIRLEPRTTYLIVGDGECREQLEAECRTLGIIDHFRFTGWVEHEDVADYINLADAVVMPSETEAMALVYLETMACGRLLIASDIPAAHEAINDGESGLLFRKGDVADLTRKILFAAKSPSMRDRIGSAARERVKEHDLRGFIAAYDRAIRGLLEKAPSRD